jgi:hypothetical protein
VESVIGVGDASLKRFSGLSGAAALAFNMAEVVTKNY